MRSITPSRYGADDWIRTSMIRFTKPAPFSVEPRRHQAGVQGIEPCWAGLEAACFPEAHSCSSKRASDGIRTRTSCFTGRRAYQVHHRHRIVHQRKERESNPQGREAQPASNRVPSPVGLPFRITQ